MAIVPLRLLGLLLLTLAITVPSCQAVFAQATTGEPLVIEQLETGR
jgi:hypothetical protein